MIIRGYEKNLGGRRKNKSILKSEFLMKLEEAYSENDIIDMLRPEVNIKPWERLLGELKEGNKRTTWMKREPHAYWKGNPAVAETRQDLMKCNVSQSHDWNARVYSQVL